MIARRVRFMLLRTIGVVLAFAGGVYAVHVQQARVAGMDGDRGGAPPVAWPEIGDRVGWVVSVDRKREEIIVDFGREQGAAVGMAVNVYREGPEEPMMENTMRLGEFELVAVGERACRARKIPDRYAVSDDPERQVRPGDSVSNRTEPASFRVFQLGRGDDPAAIEALTRNRLETARAWLEAAEAFWQNGVLTQDRYLNASRMVMEAERDAAATPAEEIAAIEVHLKRVTRVLEHINNNATEHGTETNGPTGREARAYQAEAALMLAKARRGKGLSH